MPQTISALPVAIRTSGWVLAQDKRAVFSGVFLEMHCASTRRTSTCWSVIFLRASLADRDMIGQKPQFVSILSTSSGDSSTTRTRKPSGKPGRVEKLGTLFISTLFEHVRGASRFCRDQIRFQKSYVHLLWCLLACHLKMPRDFSRMGQNILARYALSSRLSSQRLYS